MIIINLFGAIALFGGALLAHGIRFLAGANVDSPVFYLSFGLIAAAVDLATRRVQPQRSFFHPRKGGSLFWIPAWIIGVLVVVLGLAKLFSPRA